MKLDWLATDPEHSFVFCRGKCYFYTYVTTRPLRLAYFDGSSAINSNSSGGTLDTQDIVIWGKVRPDMTTNELVRIRELCRWGEQFKLDGFVRYRFDCFPRLASVFAHSALVSGWKWTCEHPSPHRSPGSVDL